MKCSKILATIAVASFFAANSFAADEEILKTYGSVTIKKVTVKQKEHVNWGDLVDVEKTVAYIDDDAFVDAGATVIPEDVEVDSVYFTREFKVGQGYDLASTLMLPFKVDGSATWKLDINLFKFVRVVKECENCNYEIHVQTENAGIMEANTPYIAIARHDNQKISFSTVNTSQEKIILNTVADNYVVRHEEGDYYWDLIGTYEKIEFTNPNSVYGFAAVASADGTTRVGDFKKAACKDGKCASVRPFRAYLKCVPKSLNKSASNEELPETISVFVIDENGNKGTTSIGLLNTLTGEFVKEDNRWFDMKGRVLDHKPTTKGTYYNNKKKVIIK